MASFADYGVAARASGTYTNSDRRLSAVQRRYLWVLEALARVRHLAQCVPFQVNIGGQQVNVAGADWRCVMPMHRTPSTIRTEPLAWIGVDHLCRCRTVDCCA